ncbi:MAG TPA: hypothetical protein VJ482_13580 [Acidimicrobiia bacterium]|nr:hypothetical protein [Acidimicrobiia bacterium]
MSTSDDYHSDMNRTNLTSEQAEALISGTAPVLHGLERLAMVIDALRNDESAELDEALVDRIVRGAIVRVSEPAHQDPALGSLGRGHRVGTSVRSLRRRITTVAATVALLFGSGSVVASAADGASPGDLLYGVDRALEAVGIGNGGAAERLEEVEQIVADGDVVGGLQHAAALVAGAVDETAASPGNQAASAALASAAQRVKATRSNQADTTRTEVGALLDYLAENIGHVDGRKVAELSRLIGNEPETQPQDRGQGPVDPPGQSKEGAGNPNPGPPSPPPARDRKAPK